MNFHDALFTRPSDDARRYASNVSLNRDRSENVLEAGEGYSIHPSINMNPMKVVVHRVGTAIANRFRKPQVRSKSAIRSNADHQR